MIIGGYYIKSRKIQESEIAYAPPHVREIWDWLLREANHQDNGKIKRGQCVRSLKDMQEGLKWFVGYRKEMYSKSKCEMAANWLRKRGMIATTKTTRGMIITVCNYDYYQDPKNYEANKKPTTKPTRNQQQSDTINKNEKNDKEVINILKNNFIEELKEFKKDYSSETLNEFYEYWSEPNKSKTKLRYQLEKTWDLNLRLKRWQKNKNKFKPVQSKSSKAIKTKDINYDDEPKRNY